MLVKKCGLDAVKQVMPEEHMKLLTNIRKVFIVTDHDLFPSSLLSYNNTYFMPHIICKQLNERKEKKHSDKSAEDRSVLSKATTARYFLFALYSIVLKDY